MNSKWVLWGSIAAVLFAVFYIFRSNSSSQAIVVGTAPQSTSLTNSLLGLAPSALSAIDGALGFSSFDDSSGDNFASEGIAPFGTTGGSDFSFDTTDGF